MSFMGPPRRPEPPLVLIVISFIVVIFSIWWELIR